MSSRLIIALIIMLLAPGVQAHNFVTGKTVTPVYIQEGGGLHRLPSGKGTAG